MNKPVLFFDGLCNLCNAAVQFVIRHDKEGKIRFAPLQSQRGKIAAEAVLKNYGHVPDSIILLEHGRYYIEAEAAWRLAAYLDGGWKMLRHLRIFPGFFKKAVYRLISRNRYHWFGKRDKCMIPTPALRERFLQDSSGQ